MSIRVKLLAAVLAAIVVAALAVDLWAVQRIENRIEQRLACSLDVDATADVEWWRGLPALATRSVGTVRIGVPLDELAGGRDVSVSGEEGRLVVATGRFDAAVVLDPVVEDGRVELEVSGVRIGGREVGGVLASAVSRRLDQRDLGASFERMPDAVRLTGVDVTDDALVVEADVDPDRLSGQTRAGCA